MRCFPSLQLCLKSSLVVFALAVTAAFTLNVAPQRAAVAQAGFGQPQISAVRGALKSLARVDVVDFSRVVYTGPMDVNPTVDRIRRGMKLDHRNDGGTFGNFERRLPVQPDRQYYREFVHTLHSPKFPGPQRVVIGKAGEVFYTGDHYGTFHRVNP